MRVVKREDFLKLPKGTVYTDYKPHVFGCLCIKGESLKNDWWEQIIVGSLDHESDYLPDIFEALKLGKDVPVELHMESRDACFDDKQLYAVWSKEDVLKLISRLQETL